MTNGSDNPDNPGAALVDAAVFGSTTEFILSRPAREPAPEATFSFEVPTLPGADLRVVEGHVREALGELYEAVVTLCTADTSVDLGALLGARATLVIVRGPRARRVCGVVRRVERLGAWGAQHRARVTLVPAAWALSQRTDSRIFQHLDTLDVVRAVFDAAGLAAPVIETRREYAQREYCVQYRERDLDFVTRLLEEEGIVLYFRHDGDAEAVVLADSPSYGLCPTLDRRPVPFAPPQSELAPVEVLQHLDLARELRSTGYTGRDDDFTRPLAELDMTRAQPRGDQGPRPRYEYPARFTRGPYDEGALIYGAHDGGHRVEVRHGEEQAAEAVGHGDGNVTGFMPGRVFQLVGHELGELDRRYLLTRVEHHLHAPEELLREGASPPRTQGPDRYRNSFVCIPAEVPWRPARRTPRPMVLAAQTAIVTGPADEEIYVDAHGRIKVQFPWDRLGRRDERSSCWIRVAQTWAGAGWGFQFAPRVGMEVLVTFLEGDPDRPLVTGCVYNGVNRPPYPLPEHKTISTMKSNSSPGGDGYNELRFEDLAGHEQVFLHAQRNLDEVVLHDHTRTVHQHESISVGGTQTVAVGEHQSVSVVQHRAVSVGGNQSTSIGMRQTVSVGDHQTVRVGGTQTTVIDGDQAISIGGAQTIHVHGAQTITVDGKDGRSGAHGTVRVDGDLGLRATRDVRIAAQRSLTLACGDTTLTLEPGRITLATGEGAVLTLRGAEVTLDAEKIATVATVLSEQRGKVVHVHAEALAEIRGAPVSLLGPRVVSSEASADAREGHTVHVTVRSPAGHVLARVRYELTLPDGTVRRGLTDDEGVIDETGIDAPGACRLVLPDLDQREEATDDDG